MKQNIHITLSLLQEARVGEAKKSPTLRPVFSSGFQTTFCMDLLSGGKAQRLHTGGDWDPPVDEPDHAASFESVSGQVPANVSW